MTKSLVVWSSMKCLWLTVLLRLSRPPQEWSATVSQCECGCLLIVVKLSDTSTITLMSWAAVLGQERRVVVPGVQSLTFGNAQPLLFLCETAECCFQGLGHHLFTSWCQEGNISTLGICQSQMANVVKSWTAITNRIIPICRFCYCSRSKRATGDTRACAALKHPRRSTTSTLRYLSVTNDTAPQLQLSRQKLSLSGPASVNYLMRYENHFGDAVV